MLLTERDGLDMLMPVSRAGFGRAGGGVAGALLPLVTMEDVRGVAVGALAFFALWQGACAASLAMAPRDATRA